MKKKKLFILFILALIPINVKAATGNININCGTSDVKPGDTVDCNITGNVDENISSLKVNIDTSDNVSLVEFNPSEGWTGRDISTKIIRVRIDYDNHPELDHFVNDFSIGTLKVKINDNHEDGRETIALNDFVYYSTDGEPVATGSSSTNITIKSAEEPVVKGLASLSITGGTLSPIFDSNQTGYTVLLDSVTTNTFSISATANNSSDSIAYINADTNGSLNANNITFVTSSGKEEMAINIVVGSGENAVTYKLSIVKPVPSNATGELSSLTIGNKNVNLTTNVYDYVVRLSNIDNYQINATLKDSTNYEIKNLSMPTEMSGEKEFAILIGPRDNSSGLSSYTYTISVIKDSTNNDNTNSGNTNTNVNNNPKTGSKTPFVVAIVLISSLILSLSLYKKNIKNFK